MKKIFVVEDDIDLNNTISKFLKIKGFLVDSCFDGEEAINKIYEKNYDLVILDIKLPSLNGFEVSKRVREFSNIPIIFLTSLNSEKNIEDGFLSGADDYITKPFALNELFLRINAIVRRVYQNQDIVKIGENIYYNTNSNVLYKDSNIVDLTKKELKLLEIFLSNKNKILSKEFILNNIYEYEEEPNEASLRVFINKLRNIIGKEKIKTIKNIGYKYVG